MKVKTLICNCKGLESFRYADMNSLPFEIESELDISYAVVHPQLCGESGNAVLKDVLHAAEADDPDTYVMVCACGEDAQRNLFRKTMRDVEFNDQHLVPIDVRDLTNDGILARIAERLKELARPDAPRH